MTENNFYVYEHWRHDKNGVGICFYVGKGRHKRAWTMSKRNAHHTSIQSKLTALGLAVDVRIVLDNLSEETAFALEIDRIAMYPKRQLANRTTGGEGVSGYEYTEEHRRKLSITSTGRKHTPEARAKIKAAKIGNKVNVGRKYSDETRRKHAEASRGNKGRMGQSLSDEHKRKISALHKGRPSKSKGVKRSDEVRAKMSAAKMGNTATLGRKQGSEEVAMRAAMKKAWWDSITPEKRAAMKEKAAATRRSKRAAVQ